MGSKRKSSEATASNTVSAAAASAETQSSEKMTFESMGLDQRLIQAIARLQFAEPTLVQEKAIPLALEGKDILARAKTGSGKTAAYVIPLVESIIRIKESKPDEKAVRALILVPTRELADQCLRLINNLLPFTGKLVRAVNIAQNVAEPIQRSLLAEIPDIVVSTPSRVLSNLSNSNLSAKGITHVVIDEADLIMSYGYEDDLQAIQKQLPKTLQVFLMSATLTADVNNLKGMFCRNPAILTLHEEEAADVDSGKVDQFMVKCSEFDKFLLAYVIFKLDLIKGKTIAFVNDIDRCYRLKLFLEQFGIRSCVLNSDLPINSRLHVVDQFNKNIYSLLIATDDADQLAAEEVPDDTNASQKSKKRKLKDSEYGASRGIDFKNVSCVLNFDLPTTARAYTHRIGRTGRAGNSGMALSFVVPSDKWGTHKASSLESAKKDERILRRIEKEQQKYHGAEIKPYVFDMKQVDAFKYRTEDAFRAVTKTAIREARMKELKQEILASEKLKKAFQENPEELEQLRHDRELHAVRVQSHLKHVPDYLLPEAGRKSLVKDLGFVSMRKGSENRIRKARALHRARAKPKRVDPLKSFKAKKVTK